VISLHRPNFARWSRGATVAFGVLAVIPGILFKGQNVAYMVGLAFAVAANANFPPLLLSIVWRRFTTAGRVQRRGRGPVARPHPDQPDGVGGPPAPAAGDFSASESGHRVDAGELRLRPSRLLAHAREPAAETKFDERLRTCLGIGAPNDPALAPAARITLIYVIVTQNYVT
jgi:hypothetical protein